MVVSDKIILTLENDRFNKFEKEIKEKVGAIKIEWQKKSIVLRDL